MKLVFSSDLGASEADFLAELGCRVRDIRAKKSLSRKALAELSGLSERYIAQLEAGKGNMSVILLRRICAALDIEIEVLFAPKALQDWPDFQRLLIGAEAHGIEAAHRVLTQFQKNSQPRKPIERVALIGLRGAGKSTLARMAAERLHWPFVELNREIERDHAVQIAEIFPLYGQDGYRRLEQSSLRSLIAREGPMLLATSGGLVAEPENMQLLLDNFYTVWIKASPQEHLSRVREQGKMRGQMSDGLALEEVRAILKAREPGYARADSVVETSGCTAQHSLEDLLAEIGYGHAHSLETPLVNVG